MSINPSEKLNLRVTLLWRVHALIGCGILTAIVVLVLVIVRDAPPALVASIIAALAAVAIFFIWFLPGVQYRRWRFHISDDEIVLRRGVIVVKTTVIPMIKIQYTDTVHGPIMRSMKLASVRIMTAGGTEEIPGLPPEEAGSLSSHITELVKLVKENV
jgi:membrane protein YdbS with pleckstrin-like domain